MDRYRPEAEVRFIGLCAARFNEGLRVRVIGHKRTLRVFGKIDKYCRATIPASDFK